MQNLSYIFWSSKCKIRLNRCYGPLIEKSTSRDNITDWDTLQSFQSDFAQLNSA